MSCYINLFQRIPAATGLTINTGGKWTLATGSATITGLRTIYTATAGPLTTSQINSLTTSTPTAVAAGVDVPPTGAGGSAPSEYLWIDTASVPVGTYSFTYTVSTGDCSDSSTLTINVIQGVRAGKVVNQTYCSSNTNAISLASLFPDTAPDSFSHGPCANTNPTYPCGQFSGGGTTSPAYNATNRTFQPSLAIAGTTYSFTYTVGYTGSNVTPDTGCTSGYCIDSTTFTIKVVDTGYAGEDKTITLCNKP